MRTARMLDSCSKLAAPEWPTSRLVCFNSPLRLYVPTLMSSPEQSVVPCLARSLLCVWCQLYAALPDDVWGGNAEPAQGGLPTNPTGDHYPAYAVVDGTTVVAPVNVALREAIVDVPFMVGLVGAWKPLVVVCSRSANCRWVVWPKRLTWVRMLWYSTTPNPSGRLSFNSGRWLAHCTERCMLPTDATCTQLPALGCGLRRSG